MIVITKLEIHQCCLDAGFKTKKSGGFNKARVEKELENYFDANKTTNILPSQKISSGLCNFLNEYFPETVCANPLADLQVLNDWQTGKRKYSFHSPYPPLKIGNKQGIKSAATGPTEAVGSMLTGFVSNYLGIVPIVRCVGNFPDFIYQSPKPLKYFFVEAKASVAQNADTEMLKRKREFLLQAINEFNAGVCNECVLVTAAIKVSDPVEVDCHVYRVWTVESSNWTTKDLGLDLIWENIEPYFESELAMNNSRQSPEVILSTILNGDRELAEILIEKYGIPNFRDEDFDLNQVDLDGAFEHRNKTLPDDKRIELPDIDWSLPLEQQISIARDDDTYIRIRNRLHKTSTDEKVKVEGGNITK